MNTNNYILVKLPFRIVLLLIFALILVACSSDDDPTPEPTVEVAPAEGRPIVLGEITDDPIEAIEEVQPIADYLAANLSEFGITEGRVVVASSIDEMAEMLASGEVDLFFDSVYPATIVSDQTDGQIFIRRWKSGVEEYHTIIFTTADSEIVATEDLVGKTVAFEEIFSTSGYVLPLTYLVEQGLTLTELNDVSGSVADDEIGYIFSGAHENSVEWVLSGRVDAAATENGDFDDIDPDTKENLVVLAETESLPRHVGVASSEIDTELLAAITQILIDATETDDGRAALEAFSETSRFDEFPEGISEAVARMRELAQIVSDSR